jgi:hypothetical protein
VSELSAASFQARETIAAQFHRATLPKPLNKFLVVFVEVEPGQMALLDQIADGNAIDIPMQNRRIADFEELFGLQRCEAKVALSEVAFPRQ